MLGMGDIHFVQPVQPIPALGILLQESGADLGRLRICCTAILTQLVPLLGRIFEVEAIWIVEPYVKC